MRTHLIGQLILMFWLCSAGSVSFAEHGVKLYTPFTKISVPPG
jgi:hypothetical protein